MARHGGGVDPRLTAELELAALPHEELARSLYRLALRRDPEPEALNRAVRQLDEGTLSPATLLHELLTSSEFGRVRSLDDAIAFAAWARAHNERPRELRAPAGTDERLIEIPWALSRLRAERTVLDCGYAYAEPAYLAALLQAVRGDVVGVDLAQAEVPGLRSVVADLRALPFAQGEFDTALCISTLEHVGRDNTVYGLDVERDAEGIPAALRELRRVAARLLVTVPCGRAEEHDWFIQLPADQWLRVFESGSFLVFEHETYELGDDGWRPGADPRGAYGARGPGANGLLCAELHPATARARVRDWLRQRRQ